MKKVASLARFFYYKLDTSEQHYVLRVPKDIVFATHLEEKLAVLLPFRSLEL